MQTIDEFIGLFADQFDDIDVDKLSPDVKFHDLEEWSSLVALSVIAMIDEEFDVVVNGEEMRSSETISDLYNTIKEKRG
jgi:Phosphopantetheine attachment site.